MRRMGMRRIGVSCALLVSALIGWGSPLSGQSESLDVKYVELQSVKVKPEGKTCEITVKAKAPRLPVGCKVEFVLMWRYQKIEVYVVEVPANKRIEQTFTVKKYTPSADHYVLSTQLLEPKNQPRSIGRQIDGDPETFPPGAVPWAEYHEEHKFLLGTEEEIAAEVLRIQTWFKERYTELAEMDVLVDNSADAAKEATEFADSKGEFEEKQWRKMLDGQVLDKIRSLQKEIGEGLLGKQADMVAYRRPLADLRELANAVAWRATVRSIELYKEKGLEPSKDDSEPKELEMTVRSFKRTPPKSKDLGKIVQRINEALEIGKNKEAPKEGTP